MNVGVAPGSDRVPFNERGKPTDGDELSTLAAVLAETLRNGDLRAFYDAFRCSELAFVALARRGDASALFRTSFDVLHRLGAISPATGLAIENHYYVTSAIATVPCAANSALDARRDALLRTIHERRALVANTNSKVHTTKLGEIGTSAQRVGDGYRINGTAAYMSLATEADVLVLLTQIVDEGPAIFAIEPLQGNPSVEIGPYLFPAAMLDSDTHRVVFHDLHLPDESLLVGPQDPDAEALIGFEMAWHQLLIPALYLGAAAGAIEEVRRFTRATRGRDGRPLAEGDGMVAEVGRLAIEYRSACATVLHASERLMQVRRLPDDVDALERAVDDAGVAKYVGTRCAEAVVTAARQILGPRCFTGGHLLERLSQEAMFGPLGPEVSSVIERRHGRRVLKERSFLERWW